MKKRITLITAASLIIIVTATFFIYRNNQKAEYCSINASDQKGNVRYLITEQDYGASCLINQYLRIGDTVYLELVYSALKGTFGWNKDYYQFGILIKNSPAALPYGD